MDMPSPVFSLNPVTPLLVSAQSDNVEEQHLQQLAQQIQPSPLQPQQHDSPMHQSPSTQQRNASVVQPYAASTGLTPQTPGHVHSSAGAAPAGTATTPHSASASIFPSTSGPPVTAITPASADPRIIPQLQNIVSTVNLGCRLDLRQIALRARNAEYNPRRFSALIMRIREPRTTALIFGTGKIVCTGAKSEEQSRLAARKYARIIQKLGFDAKFLDFKIQNIVGSCDVRFPIRLEGLALAHSQFSSYEPELFPALVYRMAKPCIVLLIFVSGKVVLTGAKVRSHIYKAFDIVYPILKGFRKQ